MRHWTIEAVLLALTLALAAYGCSADDADGGARESATASADAAAERALRGDAGYQTWCNPACEGVSHCELLLQDCEAEAESCPWIPRCVEGIDPCATVSCPEVCAVGSNHRHRCVKLP